MQVIGIYCLINKINLKTYVGQSIDVHRRFSDYRSLNCKGQRKIYHAIKKHGISSFDFEILEECSVDKLTEREKFWIKIYQSIEKGYNLTEGGEGYTPSEEVKKRISNSKKGTKVSIETRKLLSLIKIGRKKRPLTKIQSNNISIAVSESIRSKNPNWSIGKYRNKYRSQFTEKGIYYCKGGFETIEDAIKWRDDKISSFSD